VGDTPDEIRAGTESFEFKIEFDDAFVNDMVTEAEWAINSGLITRPNQDLHALFRGLIYDEPLKRYRPDRVTLTGA
jgi:sulfonate transport system substrate-binding protein